MIRTYAFNDAHTELCPVRDDQVRPIIFVPRDSFVDLLNMDHEQLSRYFDKLTQIVGGQFYLAECRVFATYIQIDEFQEDDITLPKVPVQRYNILGSR